MMIPFPKAKNALGGFIQAPHPIQQEEGEIGKNENT